MGIGTFDNKEEAWIEFIRDHISKIRQAYEAEKFILKRELKIPFEFWQYHTSYLRVTLTLDGDKIICHSETYKDPMEFELEYITFLKLICENSH